MAIVIKNFNDTIAFATLSTTDGNAHVIYTFTMIPNSACVLIVSVIANNTSTVNQSAAFPLFINKITMSNAGSSPSQDGTSTSVGAKIDSTLSGVSPSFGFAADGVVYINVTGISGINIDWFVKVETINIV